MPIRVNNQNSLAVYRPQISTAVNVAAPSPDLGLSASSAAGIQNAAASFAQLGKSLREALQKREELRDNTDYADAVHQMDSAALRFQNDFSDAKKGRDARGAGETFMAFTKSQAAELAKRFEDRPDLARRIRLYGDALSVKALGQGQNYEDHEENEYRKSVLKTGLAEFRRVAGTGTEAETALEKQKYLTMLEELDPGMDHGNEKLALDAVETGAFFDRRLAAGDYKGAAFVLKTRGATLGEHLPAAQLRLTQARKAAEAEARQRRNEAASREMEVFNGVLFNARLTGDPAEARDYLKTMGKSGLFNAHQLGVMERQVMGLQADQVNLMIREAAEDPSTDLAPIRAKLEGLPFKAVENAKLRLAKVERTRAGNELFAMVREADESEAKNTDAAWAKLKEYEGVLTERQVLAFRKTLQGVDAKRIGTVLADAEKTLDVSGLRAELDRAEHLPEGGRVALEGRAREISLAADDASVDLYATVPQLRQTVEIIDANMLRRNSDGSSYYDAETLRAMELRRKHAAEQLKILGKSYDENPAGTALKRLQSGTSPVGSVSSTVTEEELARKILEDQRANGVEDDRLCVLPGGYKAVLNKAWKAANFTERVETALAFKKKYGEFAEMALREVSQGRREFYPDGSAKPYDSTEAETVMAVADGRTDAETAQKFLAAYALRGKDVMTAEGKSSQDEKAVAEDAVQDVLKESASYGHVIALAQRTMNPQLNSRAKALAETAKIMLLQGMDADEAARVLDRGVVTLNVDSVSTTRSDMGLSDEAAEGAENAGAQGDLTFSVFGGEKIPFKVIAEVPPSLSKEEVQSRIADFGSVAFNRYLSELENAAVEADVAQGYGPALLYVEARAAKNGADDGSESAGRAEASGDAEDAGNAAENAEVVAAYERELALRRARIREQLFKSGWWGNDPSGSPDVLTFFNGTGVPLFGIPVRNN